MAEIYFGTFELGEKFFKGITAYDHRYGVLSGNNINSGQDLRRQKVCRGSSNFLGKTTII
ncbi:hypothetical protein [Shimia sp.]|uniref:hypothetical protein n=1 Tax=Shimia sp. TaxID=1954381 RepID=UPI0032987C5D